MILEEMLALTWTAKIFNQLVSRGVPLDVFDPIDSSSKGISLTLNDPADNYFGFSGEFAFSSAFLSGESITIGGSADDMIHFEFEGEKIKIADKNMVDGTNLGAYFAEYEVGKTYPAEETITFILDYFIPRFDVEGARRILAEKAKEDKDDNHIEHPASSRSESAKPQEDDQLAVRLANMEATLNQLLQYASERSPAQRGLLESDITYFPRLYTDLINRSRNALRFFDYKDQRIPYVLVESSEIEGHAGRYFENLIFVARDAAPEEWQQHVVSVHEYLHSRQGNHRNIRKAERDVASTLGKEKEYAPWFRQIMAHFNGE